MFFFVVCLFVVNIKSKTRLELRKLIQIGQTLYIFFFIDYCADFFPWFHHIVWSTKCFIKPNVTFLNSLFCLTESPNLKYNQFTIKYDAEK